MGDIGTGRERAGFPGEALRAAMVVRGWSVADLAREANIDPKTVRACLAGRMPTFHTQTRITAAIGRTRPIDEARAGQQELSA